tara:strand:+ start:837 stop:1103 length:267 start_codon:yes stop_codon:yes gene_type:complete
MEQTTTQIVAIPDEDCTELVRNYNGTQVGIVWAGCFYGPKDRIAEVAHGDLLTKCEALLKDSATPWLPAEFADFDNGLGPINIADYTS